MDSSKFSNLPFTIDGKSTAITTGEECKASEWNAKQGLTTDRKTNQRISEFRDLVEQTYRDILTGDGVVSVELIKNRLQGIATNPTTLLAMSRAELQSVKESVGKSGLQESLQLNWAMERPMVMRPIIGALPDLSSPLFLR